MPDRREAPRPAAASASRARLACPRIRGRAWVRTYPWPTASTGSPWLRALVSAAPFRPRLPAAALVTSPPRHGQLFAPNGFARACFAFCSRSDCGAAIGPAASAASPSCEGFLGVGNAAAVAAAAGTRPASLRPHPSAKPRWLSLGMLQPSVTGERARLGCGRGSWVEPFCAREQLISAMQARCYRRPPRPKRINFRKSLGRSLTGLEARAHLIIGARCFDGRKPEKIRFIVCRVPRASGVTDPEGRYVPTLSSLRTRAGGFMTDVVIAIWARREG